MSPTFTLGQRLVTITLEYVGSVWWWSNLFFYRGVPLPSNQFMGKAPRLAWTSKTRVSCSRTPLLSPPKSGAPQVTTVPSCRRAAKAPRLAWICRTRVSCSCLSSKKTKGHKRTLRSIASGCFFFPPCTLHQQQQLKKAATWLSRLNFMVNPCWGDLNMDDKQEETQRSKGRF